MVDTFIFICNIEYCIHKTVIDFLANIGTKKRLHDQVMTTKRLQEEKNILVMEMAQHCTWLQNLALVLKNKVAESGKLTQNIAVHDQLTFNHKPNRVQQSLFAVMVI